MIFQLLSISILQEHLPFVLVINLTQSPWWLVCLGEENQQNKSQHIGKCQHKVTETTGKPERNYEGIPT